MDRTNKARQIEAVAVTGGMAEFCELILRGQDPEEAAKAVGYARPRETAAALVRHPSVRKALAEGTKAMIQCELVPLSLKVAREILEDDEPKAVAVRAKLAVALIDRAAKDQESAEDPARRLAEMSTDELAELVARGLAAQEQEARTIDVTPRVARSDSLAKQEG